MVVNYTYIATSYLLRSVSIYFLDENLKTCDIRKQSLASSLSMQFYRYRIKPQSIKCIDKKFVILLAGFCAFEPKKIFFLSR